MSLNRRSFGAVVLITAALSLAPAACEGRAPSGDAFKILPLPRDWTWSGERGLAPGELRAVRMTGAFERPVMGPLLDALPRTGSAGEGVLTLSLTDAEEGLSASEEGYLLEVKRGEVELKSRGEAGLFYGCQTLEQLLEDMRDTGQTLPGCRIKDYPELPYRAVHWDVKHHLDSMRYYYDSIDRLARYKINAVIFEFEDKLRYRRRPLVGASHAVSIEEMAALTEYARDRHIEISPLVQGLGHASYILKHDEYAPMRENPDSRWAFCPCDEGTYDLLFDLYLDAIEATPGSRYLHVGGDEVGEIGTCPRCRQKKKEEGLLALNLYWLNRVSAFAVEHGRIPIFWDDMIFKSAGLWDSMNKDGDANEVAGLWEAGEPVLDKVLRLYPRDCIYMRWNYTPGRQAGNIRALDWFGERDLKVWIATAAQNVHPLLPQEDRAANIRSFIGLAAEKDIPGMLCTAWDDSSPHMETYWRGFIAAAEFAWNPTGRTLDEFERTWLQREFGPGCVEPGAGLYGELFRGVSYWNRVWCADGVRRRPQRTIDFPDPEAPGEWSRSWAEHLEQAEREIERYESVGTGLTHMAERARRNRYSLRLFEAINDFQIAPARILMGLQHWDSTTAGRPEAEEEIASGWERFDRAWNRLQAVYAETRFPSYPENYVPDRYFHMASRSEDQSWLVELDERVRSSMRDWLNDRKGEKR